MSVRQAKLYPAPETLTYLFHIYSRGLDAITYYANPVKIHIINYLNEKKILIHFVILIWPLLQCQLLD